MLTSSDVPFAGVAALASSALVKEDGTWLLYFYTWDERTWPASEGTIGMATATDPLGPWTLNDKPILEPDSASNWDGTAVRSPSVLKTDDGYLMFFAGYGRDESAIGLATSPDGFSWTKFNDPETGAPYTTSDPVFQSSGEENWDKTNVFQPHVLRTPDGRIATATHTFPPVGSCYNGE